MKIFVLWCGLASDLTYADVHVPHTQSGIWAGVLLYGKIIGNSSVFQCVLLKVKCTHIFGKLCADAVHV